MRSRLLHLILTVVAISSTIVWASEVKYLASFDMELYGDSFDLFVEHFVDASKIRFDAALVGNGEFSDYFLDDYLDGANVKAFDALPVSIQNKLTDGLVRPEMSGAIYSDSHIEQEFVNHAGIILDSNQAKRIDSVRYWEEVAKRWNQLFFMEKFSNIEFQYLSRSKKAQYLRLIKNRVLFVMPLLPKYEEVLDFEWDGSKAEIKLDHPLDDINEVDKILKEVTAKTNTTRSIYDPLHDNGRASVHYHLSFSEGNLSPSATWNLMSGYKIRNMFEHLQLGNGQIIFGESTNRNERLKALNSFTLPIAGKGNVKLISSNARYYEIRESLKNPLQTYNELIDYQKMNEHEARLQIRKEINRLIDRETLQLFVQTLHKDGTSYTRLSSLSNLTRYLDYSKPNSLEIAAELILWCFQTQADPDEFLSQELLFGNLHSTSEMASLFMRVVSDPRVSKNQKFKLVLKNLFEEAYVMNHLPMDRSIDEINQYFIKHGMRAQITTRTCADLLLNLLK